jgi:hypothetical protein
MPRHRIRSAAPFAVVTLLAALLGPLVAAAEAVPAYAPPAGWPDLGRLALGPGELGRGAKVERQGYVEPDTDTLAEYDREFRTLTVTIGSKRLTGLENDVSLLRTARAADVLIHSLRLGVGLASDQIGKGFAQDSGLKVTYTKIGSATPLGAGDNSVAAVVRIGTPIGEIRIVLAAVRVGQIASTFYFVGPPRGTVGIPEARRLGRLAAARIHATLVPANTTPPTITGTAQVGQTLSALPGTWLSFPTTYAYQWQRCDAGGAGCRPVAGATGLTYPVAAEDVGATLQVVVTARNPYGSGTATAPSTATVAAVATPTA